MKKVLFATTALVASAGFAAAEVKLSGSAEMGIAGGDGMETQFWSDIDVKFSLTGETDNGLSFGATIDLDEVADPDYDSDPTDGGTDRGGDNVVLTALMTLGQINTAINTAVANSTSGESDMSVFISGDFGTLTLGDTDGAFDWALTDLDVIGDIADANTTHAGFTGNGAFDGFYDGQILRYDYSFGDFAFAVSAEQDDTGVNDPVLSLGAKYSGDLGGVSLGVGLGYTSVDTVGGSASGYGLSLDVSFDNGIRAIGNYSSFDFPGAGLDIDHYGFGLFYEMDALSLGMNYGSFDTAAGDFSGYGLAVNYDLGGGAVLQAGYGKDDTPAATDADYFSFGLSMSF